jgi:hypothetical protein
LSFLRRRKVCLRGRETVIEECGARTLACRVETLLDTCLSPTLVPQRERE